MQGHRKPSKPKPTERSKEQASADVPTTVEKPTNLYARLNGAQLGLFLSASALHGASVVYERSRRQMLAFLAEIGVEVEIPSLHAAFVKAHSDILLRVLEALRKTPNVLDFTLLQLLAFQRAIVATADRKSAKEMSAAAEAILEKYGLSATLLTRYVSAARPRSGATPQSLLDASVAFQKALVAPLPHDARTAFVAMPFRGTFPERFHSLYAPALRALGYQPVRLWGFPGQYEYQPLMYSVIEKCGFFLGDLSGNSHNVLLETAFALNLRRTRIFLMAEDGSEVPSNLADRLHLKYGLKGGIVDNTAVALLTAHLPLAARAYPKPRPSRRR